MLESFGYTVVRRTNGKDAVDFFAQEREAGRELAGMIFDLTIPGGMGGEEAVKAIRLLDHNVPVFVVSGYAEDPVMAEPGAYGFTASLCKPFMRAELARMLEKHIGQLPR
jgi:CheY-like chemotaxis protein